ncbi:uncharacterized protein [Rutidosis leptorrhynchoides]|uniref:uncharacterized protein n=1 Tax=Rutidosis leptorrhynchoides TaxID=125765 RepID=UPI003A98D2C0
MRQGYYWQISRDTTEIIKTCDACQQHGTVQHLPKYDLISVSSGWPFCKWAIDIVRSFPRSMGNARYQVVAIEFFTKWVEAKDRMGLSKKIWVHEVPYVLWAHLTTPKRSTGETPFSLVYSTEAVIPAEILIPTNRVLAFDIESNSSVLRENLNFLEERRIMAAIRQADNKQRQAKYYK